MDVYQDIDLVILIKSRRMGWLGHVYTIQSDSYSKKALEENSGKRIRGRACARWLDKLRKILVWEDIGNKLGDRKTWNDFCKAAKVL